MLGNENYTDLNVPLRNPTEHKLANYKIDCEKLNKEDIAKKIITFYEKY